MLVIPTERLNKSVLGKRALAGELELVGCMSKAACELVPCKPESAHAEHRLADKPQVEFGSCTKTSILHGLPR